MCGRSRSSRTPAAVAGAVGADVDTWVDRDRYNPSANVSPGRFTPIVYAAAPAPGGAAAAADADADPAAHDVEYAADAPQDTKQQEAGDSIVQEGASHAVHRQLHSMRWGLIPSFNKKDDKPDFFRMFNARCETLKTSPVFRRLIHKKRCIVPLDGFYEWKEVQQPGSKKPAKQPYYVHYKDGSMMMMAGLYDVWTNEGGDKLYSYTIITTAGSKQLEWLHNRMPVILQGDDIDRWLSSKPLDEAFDAKHNPFVPLISDNITWHPVDQRMNKMSYNEPDAADPIDLEAIKKEQDKKSIARFFSPVTSPTGKSKTTKLESSQGSDSKGTADDEDFPPRPDEHEMDPSLEHAAAAAEQREHEQEAAKAAVGAVQGKGLAAGVKPDGGVEENLKLEQDAWADQEPAANHPDHTDGDSAGQPSSAPAAAAYATNKRTRAAASTSNKKPRRGGRK